MIKKIVQVLAAVLIISCLHPAAAELYPARNGDKWGYIDEEGNTVLDFQWEYAGQFRGGGYAVVSFGNRRAGIIDRTGRYVLPPEYNVEEGWEGYLFGTTEDCLYWFADPDSDLWGFFNTKNGFMSDIMFDQTSERYPGSQLLKVIDAEGKAGYINRETGELAIPFIYQPESTPFENGYALVTPSENVPAYFISENNEPVGLPEGYRPAPGSKVQDNRILICSDEDGQYAFCDTEGSIIGSYQLDNAWNYSEGICFAEIDGQTVCLDTEGNILFELNVPFTRTGFKDGMAVIRLKNEENGEKSYSYIAIDTKGQIVFDIRDADWYLYDYHENGIAMVSDRDNFVGFMDRKGDMIWPTDDKCQNLELAYAENIYPYLEEKLFPHGLEPLMNDQNKFGYIDTEGNVRIDFIYDYVTPFYKDLAYFEKDGKMGYLDVFGNIVWQEP